MGAITNTPDQLKRDEGLRLQVYIDSTGHRSIGYGHNIDASPLPFDVSNGITLQQAYNILDNDINVTRAAIYAALPWVRSLSEPRFGVVVNMGFNLGVPGLLKFHHTLAALQARDYALTAEGMRNSLWYRQVGDRARRLVIQMETDRWQ
jgi:lysozyme